MKKTFKSPDGVVWNITVDVPGSSNAMVTFRHPDGASSRKDRYNWYLSHGPEARSVTSRLSKDSVMSALDDTMLTQLFRRSMSVSRPDPIGAAR